MISRFDICIHNVREVCMSRYSSPATRQHFAIRIAFSSRRIRHTSAPHLIHQRAATALGGMSPRRRKCSLLHVKVRSGCQRDATNVGLRANVDYGRQRVAGTGKLIIAGCDNPEKKIFPRHSLVDSTSRESTPFHARRNM